MFYVLLKPKIIWSRSVFNLIFIFNICSETVHIIPNYTRSDYVRLCFSLFLLYIFTFALCTPVSWIMTTAVILLNAFLSFFLFFLFLFDDIFCSNFFVQILIFSLSHVRWMRIRLVQLGHLLPAYTVLIQTALTSSKACAERLLTFCKYI